MKVDLKLNGKRAIVTGASRGIGKAIARALAEEDVDVVIGARTAQALDATADELRTLTGRRVIAAIVDTGDDDAVKRFVDMAVRELGGVDILVNNAATPGGARPAGRRVEISSQGILEDVNVKVAGYLRTAQAAAPHMVEAGWGRIINIGGLAARNAGHYAASIRNGAISALTKNLADELGPLGVTAVAIHPGATRTEKTTPEQETRSANANSIGRIVDASEIGWLVTVLASPKSGGINGDTIAARGGTPKFITY